MGYSIMLVYSRTKMETETIFSEKAYYIIYGFMDYEKSVHDCDNVRCEKLGRFCFSNMNIYDTITDVKKI